MNGADSFLLRASAAFQVAPGALGDPPARDTAG